MHAALHQQPSTAERHAGQALPPELQRRASPRQSRVACERNLARAAEVAAAPPRLDSAPMSLFVLLALPFVGCVVAALLPTNARNLESSWAALVALAVAGPLVWL